MASFDTIVRQMTEMSAQKKTTEASQRKKAEVCHYNSKDLYLQHMGVLWGCCHTTMRNVLITVVIKQLP